MKAPTPRQDRVGIEMTIKEASIKSGLSETTIRRDILRGHLPNGYDHFKGYFVPDESVYDWLVDRRQRCGGLTIESNRWLDELT